MMKEQLIKVTEDANNFKTTALCLMNALSASNPVMNISTKNIATSFEYLESVGMTSLKMMESITTKAISQEESEMIKDIQEILNETINTIIKARKVFDAMNNEDDD